ncbi:Mediator complex, subunit Med21 [Phytophthora cactorum]|nr:Mediator complex, subunit Med21 [Phytophthora cactorum]
MEADGVKDELAAMQLGESEDVNMADTDATDAGVITMDKVSLLQESVDKTALSMFNALRLLPAATEDDAKKQETKDAITTLANDVLKMVHETDALIDDLPGLDKTEAEQMEELRRLQIESEEEAQTLRQVAEEAERWMDRARDSLRVISETQKTMADIHGGRVLAGEDSEEDDDDEEEMSFQFNGFGSQSSVPRFAVPTVVAPSVGAEDEEDEESDEDNEMQIEGDGGGQREGGEGRRAGRSASDEEQDGNEKVKIPVTIHTTEKVVEETEEKPELWQVDESINGIEVMSNAFVGTVQPSLDATIHRIAELKESQRVQHGVFMEMWCMQVG